MSMINILYSDPYCKVTITSNNKKTSKQTKMLKKVSYIGF